MQLALVALAVVTVLLVVVTLALVARLKSQAGASDPVLAARLADLERRLGDGLGQARASLESALRETQGLGESARERQTLALTGELGRGLAEASATTEASLRRVDLRVGELTVALKEAFGALRTEVVREQAALTEKLLGTAKGLEDGLGAKLAEIRADNTEKLEKMRATVEEKLQATLEARLGESFRAVSEQLEKVHKGLGEMQSLASGVGDLKRVLTNVKTRGTFGEVQLGALLEDLLAPEQFARDVSTRPGAAERVDFVVRLPGPESGATVLLPIDAKFPTEDYARLQDAFEAADADAMAAAQSALRARILFECKSIAQKYVAPPETTDFALLYLCTEGLYAEALRIPGLFDEAQRLRVCLVGPATVAAFLSSLRMGFRTLAIQKRSGEAWRVLGAVKHEFGKFGEAIAAVQKKLQEASNKVDDLGTRRNAVERSLKGVEALPEPEAAGAPGPERTARGSRSGPALTLD